MTSKIEVKELTTLSGETELTLGESGKTIAVPSGTTLDIKSGATIANNGTATGFGDPNNIDIVEYVEFDKTTTYSYYVWHVITESPIQIPANGIYMVTAQTSWFEPGNLKTVRSCIYTAESVTPISNDEDGRCLNATHWYTSQGAGGSRGERNAPITQRVFNGVGGYWIWLEIFQDNTTNQSLSFQTKSYIELVRLK
jgi:hypothetical protein